MADLNETRRGALGLTMAAAAALTASTTGAAAASRTAIPARTLLAPFAVNIDTWWRDRPFKARFQLAAAAGFTKIEFWRCDRPDDALDARGIRALADAAGVTIAQYAPAAPNFSDPKQHDALEAMIRKAVVDCRTLGVTMFTLVGHGVVQGMSREAMIAGYTAGLMRIAPILADAGLIALVEPFNTVNHPNHLLNGSRPAVDICRAVDSPAVKLNWDFYHMQLEEGDLQDKFRKGVDQVGYVQLGDVPGRHQPGTGEVNHVVLLKTVRDAGYTGALGLEFFPADGDDDRATQDMLALGAALR